jgi:hypothetical protein
MKKVCLGLVLGLWMVLGTASLYASGTFEGEVDYNMTAKQSTGTITYLLKGKQIRINTINGGHEGDAIMDMETRQITMLMVAQKMYMTMAIPPSNTAAARAGTFTDTGRSLVILGKTCEEWLYTGKRGSSSVWAAHGLGNFGGFAEKPNDANAAWADAVKHKGLFPLKIVSKDAGGNVVMTMEATNITPETLDESLFQVPAGFNKLDMGNLGAMMGENPGQ